MFPFICYSQTDTIYYDQDKQKTVPDSASYYQVRILEPDHSFKIEEHYVKNGIIKMTGHFTNLDSEIKEGPFVYYFESGQMDNKGNYHANKEVGKWEYYYDSSGKIFSVENYKEGQLDGELIQYYKNGKTKRVEFHKINDTTVTGKCYNEQGNEIPFFKYEIMPKPDYDWNGYLNKHIRYPRKARKNDDSGRVILKFVVDKDGSITDVKVVKHVSPEIDAEAVRVISGMPKWSPGLQEGKPVKVFFTLPIVFKLE